MISIDRQQFFPTQILSFRNDFNAKKLNRKIANYIIEQSKKNPDTKRFSVGGEDGWHSECNLTDLDYEWSRELHSLILGASSAYAGRDILRESYHLETWAIKLGRGGYSNYHTHPNFRLSGVYYVKVPSECNQHAGAINFPDTRAGAIGTPHEMPTLSVKANEGEGIVFESWCPHYVNPHTSDEPRISVSWNISFQDPAK